jgi:hypothetical protein
MKTLLSTLAILGTLISLFAQEYDDLYFRARHRKAEAVQPAFANHFGKLKQEQLPETAPMVLNPTDSYSARQLNPEFIARSLSEQASAEENYFVENYRPASTTAPINNSYFFNAPWNNPWNMGWFTPGWVRPWRNPYWGFYDPWMDPWMNPWMPAMGWNTWGMWGPGFNSMWAPGFGGWTVSVGYSWGSAWGWNNPWCMPYWNTGFWPYWNTGFWSRPLSGMSEPVRLNYGKRPSANYPVAGELNRNYVPSGRTSSSNIQSGSNPSGRMSDTDYYVPPARRSAPARQSSHSINRDTNTPRMRSWTSPDNSQFNRSGGGMRDSRPSYSIPSRSGSFPSGGGRPSPAPSGGRPRGIQ